MAKDVFIPKNETPRPGVNVGVIFNKKSVKGEVGIEIEVEGKKLPHSDDTPEPWLYHPDGSLRGEDNGEYVLAKPLKFKEVPKALEVLWGVFKEKKSKLDDSNRTSVHVHLNCQQWHLNRLAAFLGLYYTLEECLTEWCGEHRVGNLFCLRGIDAPGTVTSLKSFIRCDGEYPLSECLHYAGLNPNALKKFGSLEVRTLRGCSDPKIIETWVSVLERLYTLSADFPDPREVCTMLSEMGSLAWFETILGDKASIIRNAISFTDSDIDQSIKTGIRLAQDLCYCRDWSMYNPVDLKPDPFKRPAKKIIKKLLNADFGDSGTSIPAMSVQTGTPLTVNFNGPHTVNMAPSTVPFDGDAPDEDDSDHEFLEEVLDEIYFDEDDYPDEGD
jgi:hypothetical protein